MRSRSLRLLALLLVFGSAVACCGVGRAADEAAIDFQRAKQLFQRMQQGQKLTADEQAYLDRARRERQKSGGRPGAGPASSGPAAAPTTSTGLVPLNELGTATYKSEAGGLYGGGSNEPPPAHAAAARAAIERIVPRNASGQPANDGKIVFVSISMSNATQEFSVLVKLANSDAAKSPKVMVVDCAQGGQTMAAWSSADARPWGVAMTRLNDAGVTAEQVQVAWIKLANAHPTGDLPAHGRQLQRDTQAVLQNAKAKFPNLQIAYLDSRIYGGYAKTPLNPEPYAYEGAFVVRWLIQEQIQGSASLNFDPARGEVKSPLLLWGPYLWADGVKPRKSDGLTWNADDFGGDGTHPSESGREKVAKLLLEFLHTNSLASPWYLTRGRVQAGP